jgi:predicted amidohydrolase
MTPFAIAGVQMHVTPHNNIAAMGHRLDLVMHLYPWVQMVVFSELAPYGPLLHHAQPLPGSAEEAFQEMAAKHRVWLVNGSMYERREGAIYNTASAIGPDGKVVGRYRKMFPSARWSRASSRAASSSPSRCPASASSACSPATISGSRRPRASSRRWASR